MTGRGARRSAERPDPARVRRALLRWFGRHRRAFFWREGLDCQPLTPFQLLLVEFLLWKTSARAAPTLEALARRYPSPDRVLRRSEAQLREELRPLGLFRRRAACLRALSHELIERHAGDVPLRVEDLQRLTGIGQYAARATACVLAGSRRMPVDANTSRVFGRLYGEPGPGPREPGPAWDERLDAFVPRREPKRFLWAIMDLAATTCTARLPACDRCPLRADCATAAREGRCPSGPVRSERSASATRPRRASAES